MVAASIVIASDVESDAELPHMANILATTPLGNGTDMAPRGEGNEHRDTTQMSPIEPTIHVGNTLFVS